VYRQQLIFILQNHAKYHPSYPNLALIDHRQRTCVPCDPKTMRRLVRIPVKTSYSVVEQGKQLGPDPKLPETLPPVRGESKPAGTRCPRCASEMVLRMTKGGADEDGQFWGLLAVPQMSGDGQFGGNFILTPYLVGIDL
jgi:hypothetical protein